MILSSESTDRALISRACDRLCVVPSRASREASRELYMRSVWVARDEDFSRVDRISLGGTHTVYGSRSRRWDAGIIILNLWGGLFVLICRFFSPNGYWHALYA